MDGFLLRFSTSKNVEFIFCILSRAEYVF